MPEKVMPGPVEDSCGIREAVCIHTRKIFDSCRDKDCIEDLRFYPKLQCVDIINRALSVKGGSAKLLYVYVDVEPVSFNRGFYTVDMRFFYHVTLQAYLSCPVPVTACASLTSGPSCSAARGTPRSSPPRCGPESRIPR